MIVSWVLWDEGGYFEKMCVKVMVEVEWFGYLLNWIVIVFFGDKCMIFVGVSIFDLGNEVFMCVLEGIDCKLFSFKYQIVFGMI